MSDAGTQAVDLELILPPQLREKPTEAEKRLLRAAPKGDWATCGTSVDDDDKSNDPSKSEGWDRERHIRAEVIRWLCTDSQASKSVDPRGLRAYGAKIVNPLDLSYSTVPFPLILMRCSISEGLDLQYIKVPSLSFSGSAIGEMNLFNARIGGDLNCDHSSFVNSKGAALDATQAEIKGAVVLTNVSSTDGGVTLYGSRIGGNLDCSHVSLKSSRSDSLDAGGAQIDGHVYLTSGSSLVGEVNFYGARIGGDLNCDNSSFKNPGKDALRADQTEIRGAVVFANGFSAVGKVNLYGAHITGDLDCIRGSFNNPAGEALVADTATIGGSVYLSDGFSAEGEVLLLEAQIGGDLSCKNGSFKNNGALTLDASQVQVKGSVLFTESFSAVGKVSVYGAHITGDLDCTRGSFNNPAGEALVADTSTTGGSVYLSDGFSAEGEVLFLEAQIGGDLNCKNGSFNKKGSKGGLALDATQVQVKGTAFFTGNFSAVGIVSVYGAHVAGDLDCEHATLNNPGGLALRADTAEIGGSVFFTSGFSADGEVLLDGFHIGGNLNCYHGTFKNPGNMALNADHIRVVGSVGLSNGFSAEGGVHLGNLQVGTDLDCQGGSFKKKGGVALEASNAEIGGNAFFSDGFSAEGRVDILGAHIGGDLDCEHGSFSNSPGEAITAGRTEISKSAFLRNGFSAIGDVNLQAAHIGIDLDCEGGRFDKLILLESTVKQTFFWRSVQSVNELDLEDASVGDLQSDKPSWPRKGKLHLDGFVYGGIADDLGDATWRLKWLELQPDFTPQPYRQLAKVLHDLGDEDGAKQILSAQEWEVRAEARRRLIRFPERWFRNATDELSEITVGFGIYPGRAAWELCGLAAVAWIIYRRAQLANAMAPTDKDAYEALRTNSKLPHSYPPFNALIYSLENCAPLVKFGQDDRWQPDPNPVSPAAPPAQTGGRWARAERWLLMRLPNWVSSPAVLRWFRWSIILLGWVLATFFIAGLTGSIKAD